VKHLNGVFVCEILISNAGWLLQRTLP